MSITSARPSYNERLESTVDIANSLIKEAKDKTTISELARGVVFEFHELVYTAKTSKIDFPERVNRAVSATKASFKKGEVMKMSSWERHCGENFARQALKLAWEVTHGNKSYSRALSSLKKTIGDRERGQRERRSLRENDTKPHSLQQSKRTQKPKTQRRKPQQTWVA